MEKVSKKTVAIGDLHGRSDWKLIINLKTPYRVNFVGDYIDIFTISAAEQILYYNEIK
jgi:hypothetical protein